MYQVFELLIMRNTELTQVADVLEERSGKSKIIISLVNIPGIFVESASQHYDSEPIVNSNGLTW